MRPCLFLLLLASLQAALIPNAANACYEGYCDAFAYFDGHSQVIGYARYTLSDINVRVEVHLNPPDQSWYWLGDAEGFGEAIFYFNESVYQVGQYWIEVENYYRPYWSWHYAGYTSTNVDVPVPGLWIDPDYIIDGGVGYLSMQWGYFDPTSFLWDFDYPPSAGNDPSVTFFSPYESATETDAHWFAYPDSECSAGLTSAYDITGWAQFYPGEWADDYSTLNVFLPDYGGVTYWPSVEGGVGIAFVDGLYRVVENQFTRTSPVVEIFVPETSQFYDKIDAHEDVHVYQLTEGMWASYWNSAYLYSLVSGFTDTTAQGLTNQVEAARLQYNEDENDAAEALSSSAEHDAYAVSDGISPQYVYQNCGRF